MAVYMGEPWLAFPPAVQPDFYQVRGLEIIGLEANIKIPHFPRNSRQRFIRVAVLKRLGLTNSKRMAHGSDKSLSTVSILFLNDNSLDARILKMKLKL